MSLRDRTAATTPQLRLDPIRCDGYGVCAELLPELISLDEWGYPVLHDARVGPDVAVHARRAVAACPRLALRTVTGGD